MMDQPHKIMFKLSNLLFYSIIHEEFKNEIGIQVISRLLHGMGWYVWPIELKGVFDLYRILNENENAVSFLLKYYPDVQELSFDLYAEEEKALRINHLFDKGVPKQEVREGELADHFIIGRLDILWEDESIWLQLSTKENTSSDEPLSSFESQLSYRLYTYLVRAFCLFTKTPPSLVLSKKHGFGQAGETAKTGDGEAIPEGVTQYLSIIIPAADDKQIILSEIRKTFGLDYDGHQPVMPLDGRWEPLYVDWKTDRPPANSKLVDKLWWDLPARGAATVPEGLKL